MWRGEDRIEGGEAGRGFGTLPDHAVPIRALLVEGNSGERHLFRSMLRTALSGADVTAVDSLTAAMTRLAQGSIDVVLLDLGSPNRWGLESFRRLHRAYPNIPVIVLAAPDDESLALRAVRDGAQDFLVKGQVDAALLGRAIRCAVARQGAAEELRRLNAELTRQVEERTAELRASTQELEGFCYSVSHDLRSPLRGVDGFSQAVLEDYGDRLDDQGRDYLMRVRSAAQRMGQLIDDLLDLASVNRGELQREPIELSAMAAEIATDLERAAPARRAQFVIPPGLTTTGDPFLVRVVLENLIGNAWKYTGREAVARIELSAAEEDGQAVYRVSDNGVGFDMTHLAQLFQPFRRLHTAGDFAGNGMGLATAKRIVERHGGRIWATAEIGRGATFSFTLGAR